MVARPGSARAAKAPTPSACDDDSDPETAAAVNHGSAASTAAPTARIAHSLRGHPEPGVSEQTNATVAASNRPVGVSPASAVKKASAATSSHSGVVRSDRIRSTVAATHGRHP